MSGHRPAVEQRVVGAGSYAVPPSHHAREIERREHAHRMAGMGLDHHQVADAVLGHQPCGMLQGVVGGDAHRLGPGGLTRYAALGAGSRGGGQVDIGDDAQRLGPSISLTTTEWIR